MLGLIFNNYRNWFGVFVDWYDTTVFVVGYHWIDLKQRIRNEIPIDITASKDKRDQP